MDIISWNVNSLRTRLPLIQEWMKKEGGDVFLFQETKVSDEAFPEDFFRDQGYHVVFWGQKQYNGVAIVSRFPFTCTLRKDFLVPSEARCLVASSGGITFVCLYVPNGRDLLHDSYQKKLLFLSLLEKFLDPFLSPEEIVVVGGDFNVALYDEDCQEPEKWRGKVPCSPPEREAIRRILHRGWNDCLISSPGKKNPFSWWSYRDTSVEKKNGLRIDTFFLSPRAMDCFQEVQWLKEWRTMKIPSDHCPVRLRLKQELFLLP